jgi:hypothetical protein
MQQRNEFGFGQGAFVHFSVGEHRADLFFYAKVSHISKVQAKCYFQELELEFQESM